MLKSMTLFHSFISFSPHFLRSSPSSVKLSVPCTPLPFSAHHLLQWQSIRGGEWGRAPVLCRRLPERWCLAADQRPAAHRLWGVPLQGEVRREIPVEPGQPHCAGWVRPQRPSAPITPALVRTTHYISLGSDELMIQFNSCSFPDSISALFAVLWLLGSMRSQSHAL